MRPAPCLLTVVSWLLAVLTPVLLMVVTFGLERLEAALHADDADVDPIADLAVQIARSADRGHKTVPAVPYLPHDADRIHPKVVLSGLTVFGEEPGLPTLCRHDVGNPQFQPTRHANPV